MEENDIPPPPHNFGFLSALKHNFFPDTPDDTIQSNLFYKQSLKSRFDLPKFPSYCSSLTFSLFSGS